MGEWNTGSCRKQFASLVVIHFSSDNFTPFCTLRGNAIKKYSRLKLQYILTYFGYVGMYVVLASCNLINSFGAFAACMWPSWYWYIRLLKLLGYGGRKICRILLIIGYSLHHNKLQPVLKYYRGSSNSWFQNSWFPISCFGFRHKCRDPL